MCGLNRGRVYLSFELIIEELTSVLTEIWWHCLWNVRHTFLLCLVINTKSGRIGGQGRFLPVIWTHNQCLCTATDQDIGLNIVLSANPTWHFFWSLRIAGSWNRQGFTFHFIPQPNIFHKTWPRYCSRWSLSMSIMQKIPGLEGLSWHGISEWVHQFPLPR